MNSAILLTLFFLSGCTALIYQVIWQRMLTLFSGVGLYSITLIVSSFMGGLGLGSLAGGFLADRLSKRQNLILFGCSELAIALFAFASKGLFYDVLFLRLHPVANSALFLPALLLISLLWPTFFMGLSLPLLSKVLTSCLSQIPHRVGFLYGINTLGASLGAFAGAFIFFKFFGMEVSLQISALVNMLCGVIALALVFLKKETTLLDENFSEAKSSAPAPKLFSFPIWCFIYALSGFIALALEMLWIRLLGVLFRADAFFFAHLLVVYLFSFGLGTLLGAWKSPHSRQPAQVFLLLQSLVPFYAGLVLTLFVSSLETFPFMAELRYLSLFNRFAFIALYAGIPFLLMGIPTFLMGFSFPFLQKTTQQDLPLLGRRLGWLQAANILGSVMGVVLVNHFFLARFDTVITLKILMTLGSFFLILRRRLRDFAVSGFMILFAWILIPSAEALWAAFHETHPKKIIVREDGLGISVFKNSKRDFTGRTRLFVNGIEQSWLPYGGIHTQLGLLPALIHPAPKEIAIIGLGSGDTLFSAGSRPETESITCIEIIPAQLQGLTLLSERAPHLAGLKRMLEDPRIKHRTGDGRSYLMQTQRRFDIIEADALPPQSPYSGNLFSVEYFQLLKSRLKPGGLAVTWAPTDRVLATFAKVFSHVLYLEPILMGSNQIIEENPQAVWVRLNHPWTQNYLNPELNPHHLTSKVKNLLERHTQDLSSYAASKDVNTDLYPKDEFAVPIKAPQTVDI